MEKEVQGIRLDGTEPKPLVLGDGTRVTVAEGLEIAGEEHADYVRTRTRAEVAWLRVVSEWFSDQAERLDRELAGSRA